MKKSTISLWHGTRRATMLLLLLMTTLQLAAQNYITSNGSTFEYSVTKQDVYNAALPGSITLTFTRLSGTTAPNGTAQLRKAGDPNTVLPSQPDNTLTQVAGTTNQWQCKWTNLTAGSTQYDVYFLNDNAQQTKCSATSIAIEDKTSQSTYTPPTLSTVVSNDYCAQDNQPHGSVNVTVANGVGPFDYEATFSSGKAPITLSGSADRTWLIPGLDGGETVTIKVTDKGTAESNNSATATANIATADPQITYVKQAISRYVKSNCQSDDWVSFTISGGSAEANLALLEKLKQKGISFYDYSYSTLPMTYVSHNINKDGSISAVFSTDLSGRSIRYWKIKYEELCSTTVKEYPTGNSAQPKILRLREVSSSGYYPLNVTGKASVDKINDDCTTEGKKLTINWQLGRSGWNNTYYYFPEGSKLRVDKKNDDGSWSNVSAQLDQNSLDLSKNTKATIDVTALDDGTYRVSYSMDDEGNATCDQTFYKKEFVLNTLFGLVDGDAGVKVDAVSPHGNTGRVTFSLQNAPAAIKTLTIHRLNDAGEMADGDYTFNTSNFFSDKTYTHTMHFPVVGTDVPATNSTLKVADLPVGKYRIELATNCNTISQDVEIKPTVKLETGQTSTAVQQYTPKNDEGYSDGLKVVDICGQREFHINVGAAYQKVLFGYSEPSKLKDLIGGISTRTSSASWVSTFTYDKKDGQMPDEVYVVVSFRDDAFLAMDGTCISTKDDNTTTFGPDGREFAIAPDPDNKSYTDRTFKVTFNSSSPSDGPFNFYSAVCDKTEQAKGMIAVEGKNGYTYGNKLRVELRKTQEGVVNTSGEPASGMAQTIDGPQAPKGLFKDLEQGWYTVRVLNDYQADGQYCGETVMNVNVANVGLPSIVSDWEEAVMSTGLSNKLFLPVANSMYDVKWYNVTDPDNVTELTGAAGNTTAFAPAAAGNYIIEARTTFAEGTTCEGNSGGIARIVLRVLDNENATANYWMGANAADGTEFYKASNWTAGKVPGTGDDVVFATAENNNGQAAVNDCRFPAGKSLTVRHFVNETSGESERKFIVAPDAAFSVAGNITGFETYAKGTKLLIEAEENKPNGSFIVLSTNAQDMAVYATVELWAKGRKLTADEQAANYFIDNIEGSPTNGRKMYGDGYTWQQIGLPFQKYTARLTRKTFEGAYMQTYDETRNDAHNFFQKWSSYDATTDMQPFTVYQLTQEQPKKYSMRGRLNLDNVELTLTRNAAAVTAYKGNDPVYKYWGLGQNIVANSYAAGLNIAKLNFPEGVDKTVYLFSTGSAKDWNSQQTATGSAAAAGSYLAIPQEMAASLGHATIPSMQGFLLKFTDATLPSAETKKMVLNYVGAEPLGVIKNDRANLAKPFYADAAPAKSSTTPGWLKFDLDGESTADQMYLVEVAGTTDGFDNGWDGHKLTAFTNSGQLYENTANGQMQISAVPSLSDHSLTFKAGNDECYTLRITRHNLPQYSGLQLYDRETGKCVSLDADTTLYRFTAQKQTLPTARFLITGTATGISEHAAATTTLTIDGQSILATNGDGGTACITVYATGGETMATSRFTAASHTFTPALPSGMYIVTLQTPANTLTRKYVMR